jgi:uncharacterized peroxidase-related enzyme
MARIRPVDVDQAPEQIKSVYEELKKTKWRVPSMYQILAHQPQILKAHEAYFDAVMNKGELDRKLKEKVAYKVARLNACRYSTASHYRYAIKCGVSEKEMADVDAMQTLSMTEREAAALELAVAMNDSGKNVTEELFRKLEQYFAPGEIVELFATVGLMVFASRLADAFGLEPDR